MALRSGRVGIHPSQVDPITGMLINGPGAVSFESLTDAEITDPEAGQTLQYNGTGWQNVFASISPVTPATLASLQDVDLSSPAAGQTLEYDGSKWANVYASISPTTLAALQDVQITDPEDGAYLTYDSSLSKWVNSTTPPAPVVPEGSTVTPTDDIQKWLACAGITDKTYTTLNEVLADSTTLLALISSNNASDYLVRSTTWASDLTADSTAMTDIGANNYCADTLLADSTWCTAICNSTYFESVLNVKVPTMTSNTTPSGECIRSSTDGASYEAWKAFDNNTSSYWSGTTTANEWIGYIFPSEVKVTSAVFTVPVAANNTRRVKNYKIEKSTDSGSTWETLYTGLVAEGSTETIVDVSFTNSGSADRYRLYVTDCYGTYHIWVKELQFYGRQDI